jgi:hypothetical protein
MQIIETLTEFEQFLDLFKSFDSQIIPLFTDHRLHPANNSLCLLAVKIQGEVFILPYDHNEAVCLPKESLSLLRTEKTVQTPYKKIIGHIGNLSPFVIDMAGKFYFETGNAWQGAPEFPLPIRKMLGRFEGHSHLLRAVPLMLLIGYLEQYFSELETINRLPVHPGFDFHNNVVIPATLFMERSGIHVDSGLFVTRFGPRIIPHIKNELVYCEYNPYTSAGRISNKFASVNFAALPKDDGTRACFTSRFDSGMLVLIDFESFHLRLIADMIGYTLPETSVHEFFGKQYLQKDVLTPEDYEWSKRMTFEFLYSDDKLNTGIPFFERVGEFVQLLWTKSREVGYIISSTGRQIHLAHIESPSPGKLFNYLLQLTETEVAMKAVRDLEEVFQGKQSKVTLYTYDSLLIDFCPSDGKEFLCRTVEVLEQGKFPVRVYVGNNYEKQKNVTNLVKKRISA